MKDGRFSKTLALAAALALGVATIVVGARQASSSDAQMGAALHQQRVEGNFEAAIDLYKKLVADPKAPRALVAEALVQLGQCYEKLGRLEARQAYERVIREFGDQPRIVGNARARLAALAGDRPLGRRVTRQVLTGDESIADASLSSDGHFLAMPDASTGDLLIRDLTTGHAKRLLAKIGTWESGEEAGSPVLSPDSRQVAYSWAPRGTLPHELRVMPNEPGAKARRLVVATREIDGIQPWAWSPVDGRSILASVLKRDVGEQFVWVSSADGTIRVIETLGWRRLGAPARPSLSPDGRYIAYSAAATDPGKPTPLTDSTEQRIYVLAVDGSSGETEITRTAGVNVGPVWTPDGGRILFFSDRAGKFGLWSVMVRDGHSVGSPSLVQPDTGSGTPLGMTRSGSFYYVRATQKDVEQVLLAPFPSHGAENANAPIRFTGSFVGLNPALSPDGRLVAFTRHRPPAGGDAYMLVVHALATGEESVYTRDGLSFGPSRWLHDSTGLLQLAAPANVPLQENPRVWHALDLGSRAFKQVLPANSNSPRTGLAALSPDDKTLYFGTRDPMATGNFWDRIVAVDLGTGEQKTVLTLPGTAGDFPRPGGLAFAVSPDGRTLVLATKDPKTGRAHLSRVNVDGTNYRDLFGPFSAESVNDKLAWSPDGRVILFATSTGDTWRIMRIPAEGGPSEFTGAEVKGLSTFSLSADGSRIAVGTTARTVLELVAIDNLLPAAKSASAPSRGVLRQSAHVYQPKIK